jgi:RimJ/RimL family protein N-acetyltransferase
MALHMPPLETERLIVRPFRLDELEAVQQILNVDRSWLAWTVASYNEYAKLYQPPYGERAVVRKEDGQLIGACGFVPSMGPFALLTLDGTTPPPREAELFTPEMGMFWQLASSCWGQGYATEAAAAMIRYAFESWNLRRIVATTEYTNHRSQAVMKRLGMRLARNPFPDPPWFQVVGILENPAISSAS